MISRMFYTTVILGLGRDVDWAGLLTVEAKKLLRQDTSMVVSDAKKVTAGV